ncbi:MAG TPA: bifunctional serine/threonine-protein kinase/formylglycine-generating enzyme family protein [Blastocatellia bacterium]|nr:bifunctional serine/threonine-protein kinase/formylglycine-generating enzyme family protein [Blastocatellia bacterium]
MLGRTIGNYEVISRFGEGGMGELYLGRHTRLAREVIIKTIRTEEFSPKQIEHLRVRLEREAFIQSQLDNSHIVRVYDFIATEDATCMVMEYVKGRDLRKMIIEETGPIPADRAVKLFRQVLEAIDYAHNFTYADQNGQKYVGIIHRDLKPANILVTPEDLVKVTDFGIVKVRGATGGTQLGFNPGTPEYMSPEQARGRELDQRSDIYSLGVVFYEMLTGRVPFEDDLNATSDYEVRRGHIELPVPRPSEVYPGVSLELEKIVLKALEKDPDDRFQTAKEFLLAVEAFERTGRAAWQTAPVTGDRRTVLQPGRTSRPAGAAPAIPTAGTAGSVVAAPTVARPANVTTANNQQARAVSQPGETGTEVTTIAAPVKSKMPLLIGVAAVALLAASFGVYKMVSSGPAVTTSGGTGTGGETVPTMIPGMILIPGGEFQMGRDGGNPYEGPAHKVTVKPFFIDKTEVTNEQYAEFVRQTRRQPPSHWTGGSFPPGEANFPVVNVSWNDANDYAQWAGKRLPTEEEWEFAARGRDGRLYPYGNEWKPKYSNAAEDGYRKARAVGSYPEGASPFGVMDMAGNVAEWTASDYRPYPGSKAKPEDGFKVMRGGAFNTKAIQQTATDRFYDAPTRTFDYVGFRCAKDVNEPVKGQ